MATPARIRLSSKDRQRLAEFAGLDAETAKADLDQIESILDDHRFIIGVFEHPKPNEVRELIAPGKSAGLRKKAQALAEALDAVPWQVSADYRRDADVLDPSALGEIQGIREAGDSHLIRSKFQDATNYSRL